MKIKIVAKNKKAYFNYEILDTIEAGISLIGTEVKAIKASQIDIGSAYVRIEDGEAYLWNASIPKYKFSSIKDYDPLRSRKLLMKKSQIAKLESKLNTRGITLVPLKVYLSRGFVKIDVGIARGKRKYDKKEKIKERHLNRELDRDKKKYMVK